jgi:hypothetical protein
VFEVGRIYNRHQEIHKPYGGQWQSGISTPADRPFISCSTEKAGSSMATKTGGMRTACSFTQERVKKGTWNSLVEIGPSATTPRTARIVPSSSLWTKATATWVCLPVLPGNNHKGTDSKGDERQVSVFHLTQPKEEEDKEAPPLPEVTLNQLCHRAVEAASQAEQSEP